MFRFPTHDQAPNLAPSLGHLPFLEQSLLAQGLFDLVVVRRNDPRIADPLNLTAHANLAFGTCDESRHTADHEWQQRCDTQCS